MQLLMQDYSSRAPERGGGMEGDQDPKPASEGPSWSQGRGGGIGAGGGRSEPTRSVGKSEPKRNLWHNLKRYVLKIRR